MQEGKIIINVYICIRSLRVRRDMIPRFPHAPGTNAQRYDVSRCAVLTGRGSHARGLSWILLRHALFPARPGAGRARRLLVLPLHARIRPPEQARTDLDRWASLVASGLRGRLARHPVLDVFLDTVDQRAIPHALPLDLIEGVRMDVDHTRYQSFSQLRARSQRIGGVVSVMMAHVTGFRDPALDYMADLGLAIELTTLLRDTGRHLEAGRVYLPVEEMEACGYTEADLARQERNEAFERLMRMQVARIHACYQAAEPGLALLDPRGRFAVRVAFDLYRRTLRQIESSRFDVFGRGAALPAVERAWITARSMAGPITRRLWKAMGA
jgi:15-cis-phytoene synthase